MSRCCSLDPKAMRLVEAVVAKMSLSACGYDRVRK